jgi:hypothetical protein
MDHFAELFVFNGLTPFSFRANRESPKSPAPMRRELGLAFYSEKQ